MTIQKFIAFVDLILLAVIFYFTSKSTNKSTILLERLVHNDTSKKLYYKKFIVYDLQF